MSCDVCWTCLSLILIFDLEFPRWRTGMTLGRTYWRETDDESSSMTDDFTVI